MTVLTKLTAAVCVSLLLSTVTLGQVSEGRLAVERLEMKPIEGGIEFTVGSTDAVKYTYFVLPGPRLVVDFHEADNALGFSDRHIGIAGVDQVRTSLFADSSREVTRLVFDLEEKIPFRVTRSGDGEVRVRFEPAPNDSVVESRDIAVRRAEPEVLSVPVVSPGPELAAARNDLQASDANSGTSPALLEVPTLEVPTPLNGDDLARLAEAMAPFAADILPPAEMLLASLGPITELAPSEPFQSVFVEAASNDQTAGTEAVELDQNVELGDETSSPPLLIAAAAPVVTAPSPPVPARSSELMGQAVETEENTQYTGEIVTFDFRDLDLQDFFRLIGDISGLNVVLDPAVGGSVPLLLRDVPWDQALDVVLRNNNLGYELEGNILRIATQGTLQAEEDAARALREAQELNTPVETRTFILSYTQSDSVSGLIQELLSPRGNIINDVRRNALIVSDIPNQFDRVESLIGFLDTPAQQVEIEARLLSASRSFSRELGTQIGLLVNNNGQNVLTGVPDNLSPFIRDPETAVGGSLPLVTDFAGVGTSGLSFLLGAGGDVLLDAIISAAEDRGTAKLLSRPRVTTQNNQPATVSQGTQIPVQTNVNNTITVTFVDFSLSLTVTPQITEAGTILLRAAIENSSPEFGRAVNGIPSVSTQQAETQVLIPDGGTAVVGGILLDNDSVNVSQVPGLGSIPLLGHLFKSTQVVRSTSELLFFITARIKPANPLEFLTDTVGQSSQVFPE